jgi:sn-glycerol 3-phosphate transport system substrate-binding protein
MSHHDEPETRIPPQHGGKEEGEHTVSRRHLLQFGAAGLGAIALAACSGPTVTSGNTSGSGSAPGPGPGSSASGSGSAASGGSGSASASGSAPAGSASASGSAPASSNAYTGVTPAKQIEFWSVHPGSSSALEAQLVKEYNASQSETTVKLVTAGQNYADVAQKFQTALASNKVPALVMVSDVWWFSYVLNGNTVPIEPLAQAAGFDTTVYNKTFFDDYLYKGQHWAVPYARSTPLFYYNKTHFQKAGLPDRAPKTWDEANDFAKKLASASLGTQNVCNWAKPDNYLAWYYQNRAWGWGGAYSDQWDLSPMTGSGMLDSLAWSAKTMKKNGGWAGITSNSQSDDLAAGTVSFCLESTGAMGNLLSNTKVPIGVGFLPGGPKATDHVCPTGGTGIGVAQKAGPEAQLAGFKFLVWLTNAKNSLTFSQSTGYLPVNTKADTAALVKKTPLVQVALDQLDHLHSQDWARVFITGGDLVIGTGIGEVLLKGTDPKSAMDSVVKQLQQTYDRDIKPKL